MRKIATILLLATIHVHGQFPSGFQEVLLGSWTLPMEVVADHNNRLFVAERAGQLYNYINSQKTLVLDISEEVATYGDYGLLSIALDPDFENNNYIYLYYVVDRHHLLNYGTPSYNVNTNEQGATICRITRYTLNAANNYNSVIGGSRTILLGETKSTGVPLCGIYHSGGQIKFALDGTLLVSTGDGSLGADYESQALSDGIITSAEYNAPERWRCQMQNSLNGKILRLNRFTGNGVPSNPYFNSSSPRSAASRVYSSGLRNPFRFAIKPGTGGHHESNGNAGILLVGDVGQDTKEELNVINAPAQNFGWPRWEGIDVPYLNSSTLNPVNPKKPIIEWGRSGSTARAVINNIVTNVGSSAFPFNSFTGGASIGGAFYEGNTYPTEYHNAYFFSDFNEQWLRYITLDANNDPISLYSFGNIIGLNSMYFNDNDDSFYYTTVTGKVAKLNYNSSGNQAPVANFTLDKQFGDSPLTVNFDASLSTDLESTNLVYSWDFGDFTTGSGQLVSHTFYATGSGPQSFDVVLTVTDEQSATSTKSIKVSVNNTPPHIISTSLDTIFNFNPETNPSLALSAIVTDQQQSANTLSYKWEVALHHNTHNHPEFITNNATGNFTMGSVPCDVNFYYYRVKLTVTDAQGLESIFIKDLFPNCNLSDIVPPTSPQIKVEDFRQSGYKIGWEPSFDAFGIKIYEVIVNGISQGYFSDNVTEFLYTGLGIQAGKPFKVEVVARDYSGNLTKCVPIIFSFPNSLCNGNADIYLSDLSPTSQQNGYGPIEMDKSNGEANANDGNPITLNGVVFTKGIGTHSYSSVVYDVSTFSGGSFKATVGLDDEVDLSNCGSVVFQVKLDNNIVFQSPAMYNTTNSILIDIPLGGASVLTLNVLDANDGGSCDHGDWADARITGICSNSDILAPSKVLNLSSQNSSGGVLLNWTASSDNIDTQLDYEILIDGLLVGTTTQLNYTIPNLSGGVHKIVVQAKDDAGNRSVSEEININVCPNTIIIENAIDNIYSNITIIKKASNSIEAENQIINQSNIVYKAGNNILLKPGFLITSGSVFLAEIGGCY